MVKLDCNKCCANVENTCICEVEIPSNIDLKNDEKVVILDTKELRGRKKKILTDDELKERKVKLLKDRREWYLKNKDKAKESFNKWYAKNKNKIKLKEKMKDDIVCECKKIVLRAHIYRHKKTKLHLNRMKKIETKVIIDDKKEIILDPELSETSSQEKKDKIENIL